MIPFSFHHCLTSVANALGRELTEEQADRLFSRIQQRVNRYTREGLDPRAAALRAGNDIAAEIKTAAMLEKRNAALNVLRRQELDARAVPGNEALSVRSVLTGTSRGTARGAAFSIDAQAHALRDSLMGRLGAELDAAGLIRALKRRDKAFERDMAREMWRLEDPAAGADTGNRHAQEAAKILSGFQEEVRNGLNAVGAWIGKLDHYVTRQSHDMLKVRGNGTDAAFRQWMTDTLPKLDARTFDHLNDAGKIPSFMRRVWQALASGVHETANASEWLTGFKGSANLAKRVSQERKLHFTDADAWFDYNAQYGKGNVIDSVLHGLERGTRNIAVMRTLGTNPEAMLASWTASLRRRAVERSDFEMVDRLDPKKATVKANQHLLNIVTGQADIPGNVTLASIGSGIRAVQTLSKLGSVVISSLPDLAVQAATLRHNGIGLFESYFESLRGLLPRGADEREILSHLGVGIDGLLGGIANRFASEGGITGTMRSTINLFHKLNGLEWWTNSMKKSAGLMLSHNLALNADTKFGALPVRLQRTLRRYDIEAWEWNVIRASSQHIADGRAYILPDNVKYGSAEHKLRTYIIDQTREAMTEPTAGNRALITRFERGDKWGEAMRLLLQFKTYTMTFVDRSLGREWHRDGKDAGGLAHLIAATTALGYVSMTIKELIKGRDVRQADKPGDYARIVMAAMVQGGGLGIYGDFLFGQANRLGGGLAGTLAGPTWGTLEDANTLFTSIRDGTGHPAAEAMQLAKNNAPFLNLFYSRAALDYLILYRLQEMANPGYLQRMEARVKRENNQTFWLRPSQAVH